MPEENTPETPPETNPDQSQEAIKAAQFERDTAKAEAQKFRTKLSELESRLPSEDQVKRWQDLEKQAEDADHKRKEERGEWDSLRVSLTKKHEETVAELTARAEAAEQKFSDQLISLAFSGASEWFGASGKTVLLPDVAESYFKRHVAVESDGDTPRVVVKDAHGHTILDPKTGQPMAFEQAIGEVIQAHPKRDDLLRGSGKVGSGSAGGTDTRNAGPADVDDLIARARKGDKDALAKLAERRKGQGGMVVGPAFQQ